MRKHILLVAQNRSLTTLFYRWLREMKIEALSVQDGGAAMNALRSQSIDGILLELDVPVMNGLAMLTQLRQRYADIPVIVMAPVDETDALLEALESGAQDYLTTPVSHHLFKQKCKRVFLQEFHSHNGTKVTGT